MTCAITQSFPDLVMNTVDSISAVFQIYKKCDVFNGFFLI
jgi:hypothetical protein